MMRVHFEEHNKIKERLQKESEMRAIFNERAMAENTYQHYLDRIQILEKQVEDAVAENMKITESKLM